MPTKTPPWILPTLVLAQLAGTSAWFAGNAILPALQELWDFEAQAQGSLTSSVQFGFIIGTLCSALGRFTEKLSPRWLFLLSALAAALANLGPLFWPGLGPLLVFRFLTGVALAGIYPVGMTLAASWYNKGLGVALGLLVGALVLGSALPHFLRGLGSSLSWDQTLITVSALTALSGVAVALFIPTGPHLHTQSPVSLRQVLGLVQRPRFRASVLGYLGHMWELYAMWAFTPIIITTYAQQQNHPMNTSMWTALIMAAGALGCMLGGLAARRWGSAQVAKSAMALSGACAISLPLWFHAPQPVFVIMMLVWGFGIAADSPQLSTLTAMAAPAKIKGSGLTLATCLGFALTIISIEGVGALLPHLGTPWSMAILAPGPLLGLVALRRL